MTNYQIPLDKLVRDARVLNSERYNDVMVARVNVLWGEIIRTLSYLVKTGSYINFNLQLFRILSHWNDLSVACQVTQP